jgi:hypothetical protein
VGVLAIGSYLYLPKPAVTAERPAQQRTRVAAPAPPVAPDPSTYTLRQIEEAASLVGDAKRLAREGKFTEAEAALQAAEKAAPALPQTREAQREVAELATPKGRFQRLIGDAKRALEHDDPAAARTAIAEAEKLDPGAPSLTELKQQLAATESAKAKRNEQIVALLVRFRDALKRKDIAAAYRALNEAERIDIVDPRIDEARLELDKAQEAAR